MKNHEILQDAIGLIDDELIINAKPNTAPKKGKPLWVRWVAAAACLTLLLSVGWQIIPGPGGSKVRIAENVWLKEDFDAFSLAYRSSAPATLSNTSDARIVRLSTTVTETEPQPMLKTHPIIISQDQTYKFQNLIANRYAVYRSETGIPVFYDTQEDRLVDLQERLIGNESRQRLLAEVLQYARKIANANHPKMLTSEINQNILDLYITYHLTEPASPQLEELMTTVPDTDFIALRPETIESNPNAKIEEFWKICKNICQVSYANLILSSTPNENFSLEIVGIDEINGLCIVQTKNYWGGSTGYWVYDIRIDRLKALPGKNIYHEIGPDSIFRFSSDGAIATMVSAGGGGYLRTGTYYVGSYANRELPSTVDRFVTYKGEHRIVFFLEEGFANALTLFTGSGIRASSEIFISPNDTVLYHKVFEEEICGNKKSFYISDSVWYNRLKLYNKDTDRWAFISISQDRTLSEEIILQGNFVRFAADETVVIMERGGSYYAYSLETGEDVTEKAKNEALPMYAHELLTVTLENGLLFTTNLFTGERKAIAAADQYILTEDGAFAFTYREGTDYVTCINIASTDSCAIGIDEGLLSQLFSIKNPVLQLSYHEVENTLLISYYHKEDLPILTDTDVNFFENLAKLDSEGGPFIPSNPTVIDSLKVSEEVMDAFRNALPYFDKKDEERFPDLCPYNTTREEIFGCLGLTEPENYLDINGAKFILYEDDDEMLTLEIWENWPWYDYQGYYCGYAIYYTVNGRKYDYFFRN